MIDQQKLNSQSFKLLKSLAGDDIVKDDIRKFGFYPLILSALQRHIVSHFITCKLLVTIQTVKTSMFL